MAQSTGMPSKQSLNAAVAATNVGTAFPLHETRAKFGLQVTFTAAPANCVVALEGTIDGTDWFSLGTAWTKASQASGDIVWFIDKPCTQVRANCTSFSTGAGNSVSAWICAC